MFTFVEVSKNTYPYRTLHVEGCSHLARAKYQHDLSIEQVRRLDSVRLDYCTRCFPVKVVKTLSGGTNREYSAAQREFWGIQNAFKEDEAKAWQRIHAARKVVALRLALEEAEAECTATFSHAAEQRDMVATVEREARAGQYTPLEVTVSRR
jgi:hypothetical protein